MGVYSDLPIERIEALIAQYDRGRLISITPITTGIENSNYFVLLSQYGQEAAYVLTLVEVADERRAQGISQLMTHLRFYGFPVPEVVMSRNGNRVLTGDLRPVMLSTKIQGHHVQTPKAQHCHLLGSVLAQFHQIASAFSSPLSQPYDLGWLSKTIETHRRALSGDTLSLLYEAVTQCELIQAHGLPIGLTHGDAFRDNVLFSEADELTGLLDYFHAGEDYLIMDLAIAINDWCYVSGDESERSALRHAMVSGYEEVRHLEEEERKALPIAQFIGAARLCCSRLATQDGNGHYRKDPREYERHLRDLVDNPPSY